MPLPSFTPGCRPQLRRMCHTRTGHGLLVRPGVCGRPPPGDPFSPRNDRRAPHAAARNQGAGAQPGDGTRRRSDHRPRPLCGPRRRISTYREPAATRLACSKRPRRVQVAGPSPPRRSRPPGGVVMWSRAGLCGVSGAQGVLAQLQSCYRGPIEAGRGRQGALLPRSLGRCHRSARGQVATS